MSTAEAGRRPPPVKPRPGAHSASGATPRSR